MTETNNERGHPGAAAEIDGGQPAPRPSAGDKVATVVADVVRPSSVHRWLACHVLLLRVSMGAVIFTFGIMKYFPGLSPAEDLVLATTHLLTFGLGPNGVAIVLVATLECCIGLTLVTGRLMRVTVYLQAMWLVGILSPVVLLPGRLNCHQIHFPERLGGWLATTASRECLRILRQTRPTPPHPAEAVTENVADPSIGPDEHVIEADTAQRLWNLVAELPPRSQILLRALFTDHPPPDSQLAHTVGIPIGSIGPTRARALGQLRRMADERGLGQAI